MGCGESQQSATPEETQPAEPVAEDAKPEAPTDKAPDISIHTAIDEGNIEAVKQHLADGADVNAKDAGGGTPILDAAYSGQKEIVELLIAEGADVNVKDEKKTGFTSLDIAIKFNHTEIAELLRKHGGKTGEELDAAN